MTFSPKEIKPFECVFEASVESSVKSKPLTFHICGEGALPQVSILYPALKNNLGHGIINFSREAVGKVQKLPFSLTNVGTLPAQLHIDLDDRTNFRLVPVPDAGEKIILMENDQQLAHTAQVSLEPRQEAHMMVVFQATAPGTFNGMISVTVLDNEFENLKCQLIAEYKATICLTNLPPVPLELQGSSLDSMMCFGDLAMNEQRIQSLTIRNDDVNKSVKFTWPDLPYMSFSPKVGHLRPGQFKLTNSEPIELELSVPDDNVSIY